MPLVAKLDEYGRPAWIAFMILGFLVFWPIGLMILAFLIGSGRMGCGHYGAPDRWERKMERLKQKMARYGGGPWSGQWQGPSSGNRAFDEYRNETLRRLEEEQREFRDFLDRLRFAKDKTEFDQFMAERRNRPAPDQDQPRN